MLPVFTFCQMRKFYLAVTFGKFINV